MLILVCPGCFSWPSIKYVFPHRTLFQSFVPIAQQAGYAAVLGRLSLSICLWSPFTSVSTVSRGHPSLVSLASAIKASLGVICTRTCLLLCTTTIRQQQHQQMGQSQDPTYPIYRSSMLSALGSRGVVKRSPLELFLSLAPPCQ
jgi:hypothetical protein